MSVRLSRSPPNLRTVVRRESTRGRSPLFLDKRRRRIALLLLVQIEFHSRLVRIDLRSLPVRDSARPNTKLLGCSDDRRWWVGETYSRWLVSPSTGLAAPENDVLMLLTMWKEK